MLSVMSLSARRVFVSHTSELRRLRCRALARVGSDSLQVHRLVQAILRDSMLSTPDEDDMVTVAHRDMLGKDHPDTLRSANNLAVDLRALGEHEQARELEEWIKSQYRP
jgi:hypothetical protein